MSFEIGIDRDNQTVIARVSGRAAHEEHKKAREEAARSCIDNGFKRLLVDLRNANTADITADLAFEFGGLLASDERLKDVRTAHVMPKEYVSRIDVDFATCIAEIKGKATSKFIILEEAIQWLKEQ